MPGVAVVQDKPWMGIPNGIVYQKGGWALHVLRGQIGTEKFWAGIREYYRRFRDSNASVVVEPGWSNSGYYSHGFSAPAGR